MAGWGLLAGIVGSVAAAAESAAPPAPAVLSATAGAPPAATTGGASWTANSLTLRRRCHLKPNKDTTPWEAATSAYRRHSEARRAAPGSGTRRPRVLAAARSQTRASSEYPTSIYN